MLNQPDNSHLNLDPTRAKLADVERQLVERPDDEELLAQRFRLRNVVACTEWLARARQRAALGRVLLADWDRRN
jgi:hypothetical protein